MKGSPEVDLPDLPRVLVHSMAGRTDEVTCICRRGVWAACSMPDDDRTFMLVHVPSGCSLDNGSATVRVRDPDLAVNLVRALEPWSDWGAEFTHATKFFVVPSEIRARLIEVAARASSARPGGAAT